MAKNLLFQEFIDPFQPGSFIIRSEYYMRYVFAAEVISKEQTANNTIYDLGCGNGYGLQIIAERKQNETLNHAETYYGFDVSEELLEKAKNRKLANTHFEQSNFDQTSLTKLLTQRSLPHPDVVIAFEILEHLEHPGEILKQLYELLPKEGMLIASVPNERFEPKKKGKPRNIHHKHLFSEEKIVLFLQTAGFKKITLYGQPYTNRLYHMPKVIGSTLDHLTNTFSSTFPLLAQLIATPKANTLERSYSIIFLARK